MGNYAPSSLTLRKLHNFHQWCMKVNQWVKYPQKSCTFVKDYEQDVELFLLQTLIPQSGKHSSASQNSGCHTHNIPISDTVIAIILNLPCFHFVIIQFHNLLVVMGKYTLLSPSPLSLQKQQQLHSFHQWCHPTSGQSIPKNHVHLWKIIVVTQAREQNVGAFLLLQMLIPQRGKHSSASQHRIFLGCHTKPRNNSELLTTTPPYPASTPFSSFNFTTFSLFYLLHLCPYENNSNSTAFINGVIRM